MFESPIFTNAGRRLLNKAIAGKPLVFTCMKMGQGEVPSSNVDDIRAMTDVVDPAMTLEISSIKPGDETVTVTASFMNDEVEHGFLFKELGLFARDPDSGEDILYCYQNAYDTADYIASAGCEIIEKQISIICIVGSAENVSAVINQSLIFVTWQELAYDLNEYVEPAFYSVFSHVSGEDTPDPTAMTSAEIEEALAAAWNGETSADETAMTRDEVKEATEKKWSGETSADPTAMTSSEVSEATS